MWKLKMLKLKAKAGKWGGAWKDMIFEVRARLLLESSCKIVRIWIQALDLFESEQIWILAQNQLEGTLGRPFRLGAIFCHFLIWIKRPTSYPPLYNGDVGRGWLPLFWVFQREEEGGGAVIRQCGEGLGQLSNSPVSGKSYIEGRYNPRNRACDKELKHQTDRRLCLGISTENFSAWRNLYLTKILRWKRFEKCFLRISNSLARMPKDVK